MIGKIGTPANGKKYAQSISQLSAQAGDAPLTTTAQTLSGAVNEVVSVLANKADKSTTYTKTEVTDLLASKANTADVVSVLGAEISITPGEWIGNSVTKSVTGVTTDCIVIVAPLPASQDEYVNAEIKCTAQDAGTLTFICTTAPSQTITIGAVIIK